MTFAHQILLPPTLLSSTLARLNKHPAAHASLCLGLVSNRLRAPTFVVVYANAPNHAHALVRRLCREEVKRFESIEAIRSRARRGRDARRFEEALSKRKREKGIEVVTGGALFEQRSWSGLG